MTNELDPELEPERDIENLVQRVKENPNDAAAYSALGDAYVFYPRNQQGFASDMVKQAASAYEKALRLNPEDSHAELALCVLITGSQPIVRIAHIECGFPRVADAEPSAS